MKQIILLFCMTFMLASVSAQTDYSEYLNRAMEKLEEGDCVAAQKFYNVNKELTLKSVSSVEALIADCTKELHLGDVIDVNGEQYIIAHLMENKLHGFAIRDYGIYAMSQSQIKQLKDEQKIPTWEELMIVYKNNQYIGLTGRYWSETMKKYEGNVYSGYTFYYGVKDFLSGKEFIADSDLKYGVLLIHRF